MNGMHPTILNGHVSGLFVNQKHATSWNCLQLSSISSIQIGQVDMHINRRSVVSTAGFLKCLSAVLLIFSIVVDALPLQKESE